MITDFTTTCRFSAPSGKFVARCTSTCGQWESRATDIEMDKAILKAMREIKFIDQIDGNEESFMMG